MLVAVDPGGTTGLAYKIPGEEYRTRVFFDPETLYEWLNLRKDSLDQVIIEDFITSGRISSDGLYTVRLVGGVHALCNLWGVPIDIRPSVTRSTFIPRAKAMLKEIKPNHVIHEVDALAHLLQWEYLKSHNRTNPRDRIQEIVSDR